MKKNSLMCLLLCVVILFSNVAIAETATPYSDSVFVSWYAILTSDKIAEFAVSAHQFHDEIKISKCILEQKVKDNWINKGHLPKPSGMTNTSSYVGACDYSAYIFSGCTYRIQVTFWADGHEMTRYSNERTY